VYIVQYNNIKSLKQLTNCNRTVMHGMENVKKKKKGKGSLYSTTVKASLLEMQSPGDAISTVKPFVSAHDICQPTRNIDLKHNHCVKKR